MLLLWVIWLHLTLIFTGQLPAGLPLLTTALVGLILGVVVWTVRSEQGDGLPLGEGLIGTLDNPQIEVHLHH